MITKNGGPAFPGACGHLLHPLGQDTLANIHGGMSLRDYFAGNALAMAGSLMGNVNAPESDTDSEGFAVMAAVAYAIADAMLAARER